MCLSFYIYEEKIINLQQIKLIYKVYTINLNKEILNMDNWDYFKLIL